MVNIKTEKGNFKLVTGRKLPEKNESCGFSVRADCIKILNANRSEADNKITGTVNFIEYVGYVVKIRIKLDNGEELIAKETQNEFFDKAVKEGDRVTLGWKAEDSVLLSGVPSFKEKSIFELHGN